MGKSGPWIIRWVFPNVETFNTWLGNFSKLNLNMKLSRVTVLIQDFVYEDDALVYYLIKTNQLQNYLYNDHFSLEVVKYINLMKL